MNMSNTKEMRALAAVSDPRWAAVAARDPAADGRFVYSVRTTGVYCRPSCAARPARPENVDFHTTLRNAMAQGDLKGAAFSPQRDASAQVRPDGSTVDADVEAAAQARNGLEYETLVQVSKARVDIIEAAMGR